MPILREGADFVAWAVSDCASALCGKPKRGTKPQRTLSSQRTSCSLDDLGDLCGKEFSPQPAD